LALHWALDFELFNLVHTPQPNRLHRKTEKEKRQTERDSKRWREENNKDRK